MQSNSNYILLPNQILFLNKYLSNNFNATKAYMDVYHTKNNNVAAVEASRMLRLSKCRLYLEEYLRSHMDSKGLTKEYILDSIININEDKKAKNADKLKSLELLGRALSIFKDNTNISINPVTQSRTMQELDLEYKELVQDYKPMALLSCQYDVDPEKEYDGEGGNPAGGE